MVDAFANRAMRYALSVAGGSSGDGSDIDPK